jgi:transposase
VFGIIAQLTEQISGYDRMIEQWCSQRYPETGVLRQIRGVGPLTALAFILTLQEPHRFARNRDVGPFLGLCPKRDQSGSKDPQLRISKQGDRYLRQLLVSCAYYLLGPFGMDCDLRRHGERIAARGGKMPRNERWWP